MSELDYLKKLADSYNVFIETCKDVFNEILEGIDEILEGIDDNDKKLHLKNELISLSLVIFFSSIVNNLDERQLKFLFTPICDLFP